jgi:hypothetical protein
MNLFNAGIARVCTRADHMARQASGSDWRMEIQALERCGHVKLVKEDTASCPVAGAWPLAHEEQGSCGPRCIADGTGKSNLQPA